MKLLKSYRFYVVVIAVVGILVLVKIGWFSLAGMYAFMGFKAPINTRYECVKRSIAKVNDKFKLPLQFDRVSKNLLRQYWHYSYFRECLNNAGFDTKGNRFPMVTSEQISGRYMYANSKISFNLTNTAPTIILSSNQMNADYDDRILTSKVEWQHQVLNIAIYTKHDKMTDLNSIKENFINFSETNGSVVAKVLKTNREGNQYWQIRQSDNISGIVLPWTNRQVLEIFSLDLSDDLIEVLANSIF